MNSVLFLIFWFVVIVLAFFVFIVRPQRRRMAAHQALVDGVKPGDQIITTGGLIGEIVAIEAATLRLRIDDGVVVHIARGAIARVIPDVDDLNSDESPAPGEGNPSTTEGDAGAPDPSA